MKQREEVKNLLAKEIWNFDDLLLIVRLLRSEEGCPWDREQTHASIRSCMIEEAYEVVEAIDTADVELLREELGDVLFQVVFHTQIEAEQGNFKAAEVVHDICKKMIRRHPHVFGEPEPVDTAAVLSNWETIKTEEKQRKTLSSRLRAVPPMLPSLMRASKIAGKIGFSEDVKEFDLADRICKKAAQLAAENAQKTPEIFGELLYFISEYAAFCGLDAEYLLGQAADRAILQVENTEK